VIVTYQKVRGEPRAKHKAGASWDGRGDCVDCRLCVNVCPTGIDIRDGQQMECIGCGLCADACNETMDKVGRPLGLIRWDTLARQQSREQGRPLVAWRPARPRTLLYAALLAVVAIVMAAAFFARGDADLSVQRDRSPNFVRLSNGDIRNAYTIKISNKQQQERRFVVELRGLGGATLTAANAAQPFPVHADSVATVRMLVTLPGPSAPSGSQPIEFMVRDQSGRERARHDSVFVGPVR
jgi:cytochrome c oxidase accessory protein FixG